MDAGSALVFRKTTLSDPGARSLIAALNDELGATYPEPGATHFGLDDSDVAPGRGAFLVAGRGGEPVGCGAVRLLDAKTAELKRMYVAPNVRGTGLGRELVSRLESEARLLGAAKVVVETGTRQLAALALYRKCGYEPIPLYGEYHRSPATSVCLGKSIAGPVAVKLDVGDEAGRRRFLDEIAPPLLASLAPDAKPSWGRMSPQQRVEHLAWLFDLSSGAATASCPIPEAVREKQGPSSTTRARLRASSRTPLSSPACRRFGGPRSRPPPPRAKRPAAVSTSWTRSGTASTSSTCSITCCSSGGSRRREMASRRTRWSRHGCRSCG